MMPLQVTVVPIGTKLNRLLIYEGQKLIGEYERSQKADVERKKKEIENAEAVLLEVFRKHGPFVVRWNETFRDKVILVNKVKVDTVPKRYWETPSCRL